MLVALLLVYSVIITIVIAVLRRRHRNAGVSIHQRG